MRNNFIFKQILLAVSVVFFVSCDKDFNEVGDGLIGDNNFDLKPNYFKVVAYNQKIGPIQSNNLPINPLGIYNNTAFDITTANFVTQLTMATVSPTFGIKPEIESVYLDIPYFVDASQTTAVTNGGNTYVLDSIYGDPKSKIKLSIYESGFNLRDKDPASGFIEIQKYYTNQNLDFENSKVGTRLNDDANPSQNDEFFFDPAQHTTTAKDATGKDVITYSPPSMRLKLNSEFFKNKILNAPIGKLTNNQLFKEYFKGLFFKVEQSGADSGSLAMMNFARGTITIKYKEDTSALDPTRVEKSLILNMSGNTVSLPQVSNSNVKYTSATSSPNRLLGDEKLYLKGGEGSLAVVELFGSDNYGVDGTTGTPNGVADELDNIRKNGWLINNANLVFNIDAGTMANSHEAERIFLYDFTNSTTTLDYTGFTGKITRDATINKRGLFYRVDITNHIRRLVKNSDAINVKLGIVVTQNIQIPDFNAFRTPTEFVSKAPQASVMSPLGTILYGNNTTDEAKKLKLEIYYTKPN
jgi:hypothetical protein